MFDFARLLGESAHVVVVLFNWLHQIGYVGEKGMGVLCKSKPVSSI